MEVGDDGEDDQAAVRVRQPGRGGEASDDEEGGGARVGGRGGRGAGSGGRGSGGGGAGRAR